jgi:hypothetical protein
MPGGMLVEVLVLLLFDMFFGADMVLNVAKTGQKLLCQSLRSALGFSSIFTARSLLVTRLQTKSNVNLLLPQM